MKAADNLFCVIASSSDSSDCATSHQWQDSVWPLSQSSSRPTSSPPHSAPSGFSSFLCFHSYAASKSIQGGMISSSSRAYSDCTSSSRNSVWCSPNPPFNQFLFCQSSTQGWSYSQHFDWWKHPKCIANRSEPNDCTRQGSPVVARILVPGQRMTSARSVVAASSRRPVAISEQQERKCTV